MAPYGKLPPAEREAMWLIVKEARASKRDVDYVSQSFPRGQIPPNIINALQRKQHLRALFISGPVLQIQVWPSDGEGEGEGV